MVELKGLYEDRAEVAKEVRRLADLHADSDTKWTDDHERQWTEANADYNAFTEKIEKEERAIAVESQIRQRREPGDGGRGSGGDLARRENEEEARLERERRTREGRSYRREEPTIEERALALQAWALVQTGKEITDEHRVACRRTATNPNAKDFEVQLRRDRAYSQVRREMRASTASTEGGETIPEGFVNNFERALLQFGGMRQVADVMRTASGNAMPWPTTDDTGNKGALIAEEDEVTAQDVVTGSVVFNAYKYTSKMVKVSAELLEDSAFDLANILGEMLGERVGRITNDHFTTGDGSSKPKGLIVAATVGKETASSTVIDPDEVYDLLHSVDPAYRDGAGWMLHDSILLAVRKLKDGNDQYLWQPGLQLGIPDRLLSYPITINQSMASTITASDKVIAFGQLSKYKIRDVASVRLRRLVERYAEFDQEAFVVFSRHDGDLLDAGTKPVKVMQMKP